MCHCAWQMMIASAGTKIATSNIYSCNMRSEVAFCKAVAYDMVRGCARLCSVRTTHGAAKKRGGASDVDPFDGLWPARPAGTGPGVGQCAGACCSTKTIGDCMARWINRSPFGAADILRWLGIRANLVAAMRDAERELSALEASIKQTQSIGEREAIQ